MGKKFNNTQYITYAPKDGIKNPINNIQFQFLTLIANFNVTTIITLV